MIKYFKLYKKVIKRLHDIENYRGTVRGIGVDKDEWAVKWRGIRMRLELLEAKIEERNPNWFFAYYLTAEEAKRRNNSYVA